MTRLMQADPQRVFRAWTGPEQMKRRSSPQGATLLDVAVDLRVGDRCRILMQPAETGLHNEVGEYREIDRLHRLVYTRDRAEEEYRVGGTIVTVDFGALGDATVVVLTRELFPDAEAAAGHEQGWTRCLNRLEGMFSTAGE